MLIITVARNPQVRPYILKYYFLSILGLMYATYTLLLCFCKIHVNIILPSTNMSPRRTLSSRFADYSLDLMFLFCSTLIILRDTPDFPVNPSINRHVLLHNHSVSRQHFKTVRILRLF